MERFFRRPRFTVFAVLRIAIHCGVFCPTLLAASAPTLEQILGYRYVSGLVASEKGDCFAWVENIR